MELEKLVTGARRNEPFCELFNDTPLANCMRSITWREPITCTKMKFNYLSMRLIRKTTLLATLSFIWFLYSSSNLAAACRTTTTRIDCHPEPGSSESECLRRNCCWIETNADDSPQQQNLPLVGQPNCFFPSDFRCYQISPIETEQHKEDGRQRSSSLDADDAQKGARNDKETTIGVGGFAQQVNVFRWTLIRSNKCPASGFTDDATKLLVEVGVYGESLINIKISEPDRQRFVPSLPEIKLPVKSNNHYYFNRNEGNERGGGNAQDDDTNGAERIASGRLVAIELQAPPVRAGDEPQTAAGVLKVIHQISGAILFEADLGKLIYSRQFVQLPTYLPPSSLVYGLGQHMGDSLLKSSKPGCAKSYTMFNYGHPPQANGRTAYSSYPFYINLAQLDQPSAESSRTRVGEENFERKRKLIATGGLMLNSGPVDVILHSSDAQKSGLTWRLISGIVDLYLFMGPKPHDVVGQYQSLVGSPSVPPAWSLGYHQSRHNYMGLMQIKLAWAKTRSAGIPLETIWTDIDFLWRGTSYTVNDPELNELVKTLQSEFDMHYVPIVDPAISVKEEIGRYKPLELAKEMEIFASYPNRSIPIVTSWTESRESALIDFTHPEIVAYLKEVLSEYKATLNYDGIWLDMNEPEVFSNVPDANGVVCSADEPPQYLPAARSLHDKTMCMATEFKMGKHQDLHNLYAFYQCKAHYEALKILNPNKRPFILSRSQFVGQGKYSGTWLGDLGSTFEQMRWSLIGMIESNWFGQPLVGADICGFFGSTTDELCARWFSLGAFYPFSRNHNHGPSRDQDPGSLNDKVQLAARVAMIRRYSLLPYLYTLFYDNHYKHLPVVRSVLFESFDGFMTDSKLSDLPQIDDQFMWGSALMFAPILESNSESRSVYLPAGIWYDISIGLPDTGTTDEIDPAGDRTRRRLEGLRQPINCRSNTGCWIEDVFTPLGSMNIYLKGGQIIPTFRHVNHEDSVGMAWSKAAFFLEAAVDADRGAFGSLFWDSGESEIGTGKNHQAIFWIQSNKLVISGIESNYEKPLRFAGFVVYGVRPTKPVDSDIMYQGARLAFEFDDRMGSLSCQFKSAVGDEPKYLTLERFDRLEFKW